MGILPIPSLSAKAATVVAVQLWYHEDLNILANPSHPKDFSNSRRTVISNINRLPLAETLKHDIQCLVDPLSKHIEEWIRSQSAFNLTLVNLHQVIHWNVLCMIDVRRTAEAILQSCTLETMMAFQVACENGLYDQILNLWPSIQNYYLDKIYPNGTYFSYKPNIITFWVLYLSDQALLENIFSNDEEVLVSALELSVLSGCPGSAELFLKKLNPSTKRAVICSNFLNLIVKKINSTAMFVLLLDHLNVEDLHSLFVTYITEIMTYFMMWPLYPHFISATSNCWTLVSEDALFGLVQHMALYSWHSSDTDTYMYKRVLNGLWQYCSEHLKNFVISKYLDGNLLKKLFNTNVTEDVLTSFFASNSSRTLRSTLHRKGYLIIDMVGAVFTMYLGEDRNAFKNFLEKILPPEEFAPNFHQLYLQNTLDTEYVSL